MAEFDWLKSAEFKKDVQERVKTDAAKYGMKQYETGISEKIFQYAEKYGSSLIQEEIIKAASVRKTKEDALYSIDVLMENACIIAKRDNRDVVKQSDLDEAYTAKFCMIWPFCGKTK